MTPTVNDVNRNELEKAHSVSQQLLSTRIEFQLLFYSFLHQSLQHNQNKIIKWTSCRFIYYNID